MTVKTVDLLLTHGLVVTMDENRQLVADGAVAVKGDRIVEVGNSIDITAKFAADQTIDCHGCAIIPGLVDAHAHLPMTLMRGLADDLRLDVWLYGYMMPVEREFVGTPFCQIGTSLACAELIRSGVSTFCEMYYLEAEVASAAAEAGLRGICAQSILKFPTPDAASYEESLAYSKEFIERWKGHPLITPAVGPHAAYTATPQMLSESAELALSYDVPLHIHIAETALEVENSRAQYGMRVVPWLEEQGVLDAKIVAAHCVHIDRDEMQILKEHGVGVAHCPSSNLKLASGVAPVQEMIDVGLKVGVGTDGPASNNDLDMFEETRLAAFLAKGCFADPVALPAQSAFAMATIEGARAIHLGHIIGSLEPGKRADIAIVNMEATHQVPRFHRDPNAIYSQLVYAGKSTDVRDLIVNGKILMRDRQLRTLDEEALHTQAKVLAQQMDSFLIAREGSILSKLLAIGDTIIPQETFEIQAKIELEHVDDILDQLVEPLLTVTRSSVRNQYDTYFLFKAGDHGRLRYREDEVLEKDGTVQGVFYTMTMIVPGLEHEYSNSIVLTRSRYTASADRSLRFYREYFNADQERQVFKRRLRFHVIYQDTDFVVNLDEVTIDQEKGCYLEIKSRTWSAQDAEHKAELIGDLLDRLGTRTEDRLKVEYVDFQTDADPRTAGSG